MFLAAAFAFGLSLVLWGIGADGYMPTPSRPGYDPSIDRERSRARSRNQF